MGENMDFRVAPGHHLAVEPDRAVAIIHRYHLKTSLAAQKPGAGRAWTLA
jgi:hypothetical protein